MTQLFGKYDIFRVIETNKQKITHAVENLDPNYLLNANEEDLGRSIASEIWLDMPSLDIDRIHVADSQETKIEARPNYMNGWANGFAKAVKITIAVPFSGDRDFFFVKPSSLTYGGETPEDVQVSSDHLELIYVRTDNNAAAVKKSYESYLETLKQNLASLKQSVDQFNSALENQVRELIQRRKSSLVAQGTMVEALGLPIKRRQGMPTTYAVPINKRNPRIARPPASSPSSSQQEPFLEMEEYEHILTIVRNMVLVMEQSPKAFDGMSEEDLRTHFLLQLNGQYEGRATGETFNYQGKTDILIREGGRNIFIAECKFWHGEQQFLDTIGQLLSYLSWRDTKTAVIIFNRNANFTEVLQKIEEFVPKHSSYKRTLKKIDESSFRYIFHQTGDPNREIMLSVLVFDVPTAKHRVK
jgi:hypothetical protein